MKHLTVNRSIFDDENKTIFSEAQKKLKIQEFREASKWLHDPAHVPELMYHMFFDYLHAASKNQNDIVFFDVGAAEGCYTHAITKYFDKFKIVAFEPESERLDVFEENLFSMLGDLARPGNPNFSIEVHQKLVTDGANKTETLRHYVCQTTGGGAGSSRIHKADRPNRDAYDIKYETTTLDDFVDSFDKVDSIKIDVEGAEVLVLNGAKKFINKFKPIIFLEVHSDPDNGNITKDDVINSLQDIRVPYNMTLLEDIPDDMLSYWFLAPADNIWVWGLIEAIKRSIDLARNEVAEMRKKES